MEQEKIELARLVVGPEVEDQELTVPVGAGAGAGSDSNSFTIESAKLAAQPDRLIGTCLEDKIMIESVLGHGGMSIVYRGRHLVLDRPVAVKVIFPGPGMNDKMLLRLQQEARTAFSLSHENLSSVHDVSVTADGLPYLVMDLAEGVNLATMLEEGPLKPDVAIDLFRQVSEGLSAAHGQKVIHRDIKPGNIVVEKSGDNRFKARIVDFGIAKKVSESGDEANRLTQTGEVFGTPLYMSPEQCRGDKLDERADIYSLGCVMYEALTGTPPYKGESAIATIMAHLSKPLPTPPKEAKISAELLKVVHHCMAKKSSERYQTMAALHADLVALQKGGATSVRGARKLSYGKNLRIACGLSFIAVSLFVAVMQLYTWQSNNAYKTIDACNAILAKNPHDARALVERGKLFKRRREYTKAIADYTEALTINPDRGSTYGHRAAAYIALKKYSLAVADLDRAIKLSPSLTWQYRERAIAQINLLHYDEAINDADIYLAAYPRDLNTLLLRAHAYSSLGNLDKAEVDARKAIELSPNWGGAYAELARIQNRQSKFSEAEASATRAIASNREVKGYNERAYARFRLRKLDQARADIEAALELDPNDLQAKLVEAFILVYEHSYDLAMDRVENILRISPNWTDALKEKQRILVKMGKSDVSN